MKPQENLIIDSTNTENEEVSEFSQEVNEFYQKHPLLLYEEPILNENSFINFLSNGSCEEESKTNETCSFKIKVDEDHANPYANGIGSSVSETDETEFFQNKIYSSHRRYSRITFNEASCVESSLTSLSKKCSSDNSNPKKNGSVTEPVVISNKKKAVREDRSIKIKNQIKQPEIPDNFQLPPLHAHFKNSVNNCHLNTVACCTESIASSSKTLTEAEKFIIASEKSKLKKEKTVKNSKTVSLREVINRKKKSVQSFPVPSVINPVKNKASKDTHSDYLFVKDKAIEQGKKLSIPLIDILKSDLHCKELEENGTFSVMNKIIDTLSTSRKIENSKTVENIYTQKNSLEKRPPKANTEEKFPKIKMTARKSFKQNTLNSDSHFSSEKQLNSNSVEVIDKSITSKHDLNDSGKEDALADTKPVIRRSSRVAFNKKTAAVSKSGGEPSKNSKLKDKKVSAGKKIAYTNNLKGATELTDNLLNNSEKRDLHTVDDYADVEIKMELEIEPSLPSSDSFEINDSMISENPNTSVHISKAQLNSQIFQLLNKISGKKENGGMSEHQSAFINKLFNQSRNLKISTEESNKLCSEETYQVANSFSLQNRNSMNMDNDQPDEEKFIAIKEVKSLAKEEAEIANFNSRSFESSETSGADSPEKNSSVHKQEYDQQKDSFEKILKEQPKKINEERSLEPDSLSSLIDLQSKSEDEVTELTVKKTEFNKILAKSVENFRNRRNNQKKSESITSISEHEQSDSDHDCLDNNGEALFSLPEDVEDVTKINLSSESPSFVDSTNLKYQSTGKEGLDNMKESRQQRHSLENSCQELPQKRKGRNHLKAESIHGVNESNQYTPKRRGRKPSKLNLSPCPINVQSDNGSTVINNVKTSDFNEVLPKISQNFKNKNKNRLKSDKLISVEYEVPTLQQQSVSNSDHIFHNNNIKKRRSSSMHSIASVLENENLDDYSLEMDSTAVNNIAKSPGRRKKSNSDYRNIKTGKLSGRKKRKLSSADTLCQCNRDVNPSDNITIVNHIPKKRGRKKRSCSVDLNSEYSADNPTFKRKIKTPAKFKDCAEYEFTPSLRRARRKRSSAEESVSRSDVESEPSVTDVNNFNIDSHNIVKKNPQQSVLLNNNNVFYEMYPVNPQCKILYNPANNMHVIAAPLMTSFNQPSFNQQLMANNFSSVNSNLVAKRSQYVTNNNFVQSQLPQFAYTQNASSNLSILPFIASSQNMPSMVSVPQIPQITVAQHAPSIVTAQNPSTMVPSVNGQAQQMPNPLPNSSLDDKNSAKRKRKFKRSNSVKTTESSVQMRQNELIDKNSLVTSTQIPIYVNKVCNLYQKHQFSSTRNFVSQNPQRVQFNNVQQPSPIRTNINLPINQNVQTLQVNSVKQQGFDGVDWQTVLTKVIGNATSNLPIIVNGSHRNFTVRDFFSDSFVESKLTAEVSKYSELESDLVDFSKVKFVFQESYLDEPLVQVLKEFVFTHLFPLYPSIEGKHGEELGRSLFIEAYKKYSMIVCGLLSNLLAQSDMKKFTVNNLTSVLTFIGIIIIFCKYKECMKKTKQ